MSDSGGAVEIEVRMVRGMDYRDYAMNADADARAACYLEVRVGDSPTGFGGL
ncbi:hypothetical protein [Cupriavidus oxalaticus]|uniref:hypothetical protein n=1 Tax=Cupriavidus oxalaticus TaxID=96344 RepID=UPI003175E1BC